MSLVITIVSISLVGIFLIYVLINSILRNIFYFPHIPNIKSPADYNITFTEHFLKTGSNKKIQIWDLNPESSKTVILAVHGWSKSADSLLPLLSGIKDSAHLILLNTRNHGGSDSEKDLSFSEYKEDIQTAIEFIKSEIKNKDIILLGHSFGAATVLEIARLENSISGLILLSLFSDGERLMRRQLGQKKIPKQLIDSLIKFIEFKNGEKLSQISPKEIVSLVKIPILMMNGENDKCVSKEEFQNLKKQLDDDSKAVLVENADHVSVLENNKAKSEIVSFLNKQFETKFIFNPTFLRKTN